jgi:hypothetical protein
MGVLRIGTDAGIEGTNFLSYPGPGPEAIAREIVTFVKPLLLGADPLEIGRHLPFGISRARLPGSRFTGCWATAETGSRCTCHRRTTRVHRNTLTRGPIGASRGGVGTSSTHRAPRGARTPLRRSPSISTPVIGSAMRSATT